MKASIHSFFAGGTVDGPGIRYVIFFKGCPLRCKYCHNPDTWKMEGGMELTVDEIVSRAIRYKGYFGAQGGVTCTGGEPLVQLDFLIELFKALKAKGINTCLDTSGILYRKDDPRYHELIKYTDLVLLDIKHIDNEEHKILTGMPNDRVLEFAEFLSDNGIHMWIRHVLVPGITLNDEYLKRLRDYVSTLKTVDKIEVLPYHTMGVNKYTELGIKYPLEGVNAPTKEEVRHAKEILGVIKNEAK